MLTLGQQNEEAWPCLELPLRKSHITSDETMICDAELADLAARHPEMIATTLSSEVISDWHLRNWKAYQNEPVAAYDMVVCFANSMFCEE